MHKLNRASPGKLSEIQQEEICTEDHAWDRRGRVVTEGSAGRAERSLRQVQHLLHTWKGDSQATLKVRTSFNGRKGCQDEMSGK